MELRQLRYFIKAAEFLNFTEAASAVFISQSTGYATQNRMGAN